LLIVSRTFPSLVILEGEEEEDNTDQEAKDVAAANDNNGNNDNNNEGNNNKAAMPPKVKPVATAATKTATKKPAAKTETMTLLALSPPTNFSVDSINK
jgi:hypothetical protein